MSEPGVEQRLVSEPLPNQTFFPASSIAVILQKGCLVQ